MVHKSKDTIEDKHLKTNIHISKHICACKECPLSVFANNNDVVMFGAGNIFASTVLVLPSYDIKAKVDYMTMLSIIETAYNKLENKDIYEECYVTRSVKCHNKSNYDLIQDAINHCKEYLYYEIIRINPKRIIIFDNNFDTTELIMSATARITNVISPGVMYYDNDYLKHKFMKQFKEALYDT